MVNEKLEDKNKFRFAIDRGIILRMIQELNQ